MDLHEKRQLDLAEQMARVNQQVARARAHARPWRSIMALVLAIAAAIVAGLAGQKFHYWTGNGNFTPKLITAGCIAAFCVLAAVAVVGLAAKTRDVLSPAVGTGHAAVVRYAILLVGGATILLLTISLLKIPVGQLLVGGAVTSILLGIAAQQSLANVFAGLVLLFSRPFAVGDYIRVQSGALGGVTEGLVTEIGITYLQIDTEDGLLHLPNSQVLAAAVGPAAASPPSGPAAPDPPPAPPSAQQATAGTAAAVPAVISRDVSETPGRAEPEPGHPAAGPDSGGRDHGA